jgi:hypothetical protein
LTTFSARSTPLVCDAMPVDYPKLHGVTMIGY